MAQIKMRIWVAAVALMAAFTGTRAQSWRLTVVDGQGQAVACASVAALTADSAYVAGTLTDDDGAATLEMAGAAFVRVSALGYVSITALAPLPDTLRLEREPLALDEVTVRAVRRFVTTQPRGIDVDMDGNPLAELVSAHDALRQMPLIDLADEHISVFALGRPEIYIGHRLVRDEEELRRLSPKRIARVEILTRPGARYGGDVKAVIVIHLHRAEEGLAVSAAAKGEASDRLSGDANADVTLTLANGLTLFGGANVAAHADRKRHAYTERYADVLSSDADGTERRTTQKVGTYAGASLDLPSGNSVGLRYEFARTPEDKTLTCSDTRTAVAGASGRFEGRSRERAQDHEHYLNAYTSLGFGPDRCLTLSADADYLSGANNGASVTDDHDITLPASGPLTTVATAGDYEMVAAKANLNFARGGWDVDAGAQYARSTHTMHFAGRSATLHALTGDNADRQEQDYGAAYATANLALSSEWMLTGGLRYEIMDLTYRHNGADVAGQPGHKGYWLPECAVNYQHGSLALALAYSKEIGRPGYSALNNNMSYVTHTLWQLGNPLLRPSRTHTLALNVRWRQSMVQALYFRKQHFFQDIYYHQAEDGVDIRQKTNLPPYNLFIVMLAQSADVGLWHPTVQFAILKQDLRYGGTTYDKLATQTTVSSRFDLPWQCRVWINGTFTTRGQEGAITFGNKFTSSLMATKSAGPWTFQLNINDPFNSERLKYTTATHGVVYGETRRGSTRSVTLSVAYTLRDKKRYGGQGAAAEERARF